MFHFPSSIKGWFWQQFDNTSCLKWFQTTHQGASISMTSAKARYLSGPPSTRGRLASHQPVASKGTINKKVASLWGLQQKDMQTQSNSSIFFGNLLGCTKNESHKTWKHVVHVHYPNWGLDGLPNSRRRKRSPSALSDNPGFAWDWKLARKVAVRTSKSKSREMFEHQATDPVETVGR